MLLVYADFDRGPARHAGQGGEGLPKHPYKQHVIHNWIDEKKKARHGAKPRVYAAIQGGHIVVFAQQEARVAQALDVLDRAAPNLAGSGVFAQLGASGSSSFLQAAARKLDLPGFRPQRGPLPACEDGAPADWRGAGAVEGDAEP